MSSTLLIVESPNKARKIQGFLGRDVVVRASVGHVCDLPKKDYGVDLATLEEHYEVTNAKVIGELRALMKSGGFERVLLGTDPDREGEAIAWHLARELRLGRGERRVEFREITAAAVRAALARPRAVDLARVDAQRARRVLDRVVGFDVSSEICWPAGASSAGRVQTPALHLLCEREREILAFVPEEYWTVGVAYGEGFDAVVPAVADDADDAERQEQGGRQEGRLQARRFPARADAEWARDEASRHPHVVRAVDRRRTQRRPEPPYTTSTLQQDASRKLRLSARQAADQAQALFEAGYITYHRTDSTRVSDEAAQEARDHIAAHHPDALPERPPQARSKAGAQDAHEAIRPTALEGDDSPPRGTEQLYALIRARYLASQCKPATFDRTTIWIDAGPVPFAAEGAVLVEPGFLHYWKPYARQEERELPAVVAGQQLTPGKYAIAEKRTSPPPRYDTGALIRKLELSGIGRPATFASIIETLLRRDYVVETTTGAAGAGKGGTDGKADGDGGRPAGRAKSAAAGSKRVLQPTALGLQVDGLLSASLPTLVGEEYTAAMEAALDHIERREDGETRQTYLRRWYDDFRSSMKAALPRAAAYRAEQGLTSRGRGGGGMGGDGNGRGEETSVTCDRCGEATYRKLTRRKGKGTFLACPACNMMRDVRARTRPAACPRCASTLIERRGKRKGVKFWGCVRYGLPTGACDYVEWQDPPPAADPPALDPPPRVPPRLGPPPHDPPGRRSRRPPRTRRPSRARRGGVRRGAAGATQAMPALRGALPRHRHRGERRAALPLPRPGLRLHPARRRPAAGAAVREMRRAGGGGRRGMGMREVRRNVAGHLPPHPRTPALPHSRTGALRAPALTSETGSSPSRRSRRSSGASCGRSGAARPPAAGCRSRRRRPCPASAGRRRARRRGRDCDGRPGRSPASRPPAAPAAGLPCASRRAGRPGGSGRTRRSGARTAGGRSGTPSSLAGCGARTPCCHRCDGRSAAAGRSRHAQLVGRAHVTVRVPIRTSDGAHS